MDPWHGPVIPQHCTVHSLCTNEQSTNSCAGPSRPICPCLFFALALPPCAPLFAPPSSFWPVPFLSRSAPNPQRALVQKLALAYWSFHYAKRIVETFTIHKWVSHQC